MRCFLLSMALCFLGGCAGGLAQPPAADTRDSQPALPASSDQANRSSKSKPTDSETHISRAASTDSTTDTTTDPTHGPMIDNAGMVKLAKTDPIAFLEQTIARYDRDVRGYTVTLVKHERIDGKLNPRERIDCSFRENPFSVLMVWKEGVGLASKTLYVAGENDGKLLAQPSGWKHIFGAQSRDPQSEDAMKTSRIPITQFGLKEGALSTLAAWKKAKKRGDLKVVYQGVKRLPELNDRPCWEMKRVNYKEPENDGITESTFYYDTENWLQIGSILHGEGGKLIASYYFRDLRLNPDLSPGVFTRESLR